MPIIFYFRDEFDYFDESNLAVSTDERHQAYSKTKKKAFSIHEFKKILQEDLTLEFDERPSAQLMTKETFDFFEVKEVINCSELFDHSI